MKVIRLIVTALILSTFYSGVSDASVTLDHSRLIYEEEQDSVSISLKNNSKSTPYLLQNWLEDRYGKKITSPFIVIPPLIRIEPDETSALRINRLEESRHLPNDIESLFYLNVREIPPKNKKLNAVSFALQTRIKVIYRPASLHFDRRTSGLPGIDQLTLTKNVGKVTIYNPTPYWITLIGTAWQKAKVIKDKSFKTGMIPPHASQIFTSAMPANAEKIILTYINDDAEQKQLILECENALCKKKR